MTNITEREDLDLRVHAIDETRKVAERALQSQLPGNWTWLTPQARVAATDRVSILAKPQVSATQVTEALLGEEVDLLEERENGWAWVRTRHDGYLGFTRLDQLSENPTGPTLQVTALRGHLFRAPNITSPILGVLSCGARVALLDETPIQDRERMWWRTRYCGEDAYVH